MEDDASVRKLVELIFSKQFNNTAEVTAPDLSTPICLLTNDFCRRMQGVLCMKQMIFNSAWQKFIVKCPDTILRSDHLYLRSIMFACLTEHKCYQNIFESFISVCVLLKLLNDGILNITGMDFRDLHTDAFIVLYDNVMKNTFCKNGGFRRLVEYIGGHRYLTWKWNCKDPVSPDHPTCVKSQEDIKKKVEKELRARVVKRTEAELEAIHATSSILAQKVLSSTSVELPTFPSNPDMIKCLAASRNEETAGKTERERIIKAAARFVDMDETRRGCSGSKTNHAINQNGDNARYEITIQAVIRHNHSRSSGHTNSDNQVQKGADGILEQLKETIKSFITVLEEYDKE